MITPHVGVAHSISPELTTAPRSQAALGGGTGDHHAASVYFQHKPDPVSILCLILTLWVHVGLQKAPLRGSETHRHSSFDADKRPSSLVSFFFFSPPNYRIASYPPLLPQYYMVVSISLLLHYMSHICYWSGANYLILLGTSIQRSDNLHQVCGTST